MLLSSLFVTLLSQWMPSTQAQTCGSAAYSQPNVKMQGHVIKSLSTPASSHCVDECKGHQHCHSINFDQAKDLCELNNATHLTNPESMVYSRGSQYLNYFLRPAANCSNKLCSKPRDECVMDSDGLNYKCTSGKGKHGNERKRTACQDVLSFPRKGIEDKVLLENAFDSLTAFTVSLWVQTDPSTPDHTPFSYATTSSANEVLFFLTNTQTFFGLGNAWLTKTPPTVVDGKWHHLCFTWENTQGKYHTYIDGVMKGEGAKKIGRVITKGAMVLGQDQDSYKGGFESFQSLQGNLTSVNLWNKVLTAQEVSVLAKSCTAGEGNIVKWSDLKDKGEGDVKLICTSACV
ncbi:hypothetical protein QZH41_011148 [Actinostola sp. cb2023]|nr:hypothetical protein QZH41_011148 [Actinostola sp. cb2023]